VVVESGRVTLSNPEKVFWPDEQITKADLFEYYRAVAPVLVPHLRDRPFTMRRYPDGASGKAFFQKDAPKHMPEWIPTYHALVSTRQSPPRKKWIDAPLVNEEDALLWMVNMGCIDMNTWYSRVDKPDRPDFVLIDSNQNGEGKTIASVYSVRPRPGAPVSTPLLWDEVNEELDPLAFTMDVVLDRVREHGDLFEGVLTTRQRIDRALNALR